METSRSNVDGIDVNGSTTATEQETLHSSDASTNTDEALNARSSSVRNLENIISENLVQLSSIIALRIDDQTRQGILETIDYLNRRLSSLRDVFAYSGNNTTMTNTRSSSSGPLAIAEDVQNRRDALINTDVSEPVNFSPEDNADGCSIKMIKVIFESMIRSLRCIVYISVITQLMLIICSLLQLPFIAAVLCFSLSYLVPNYLSRLLIHQMVLISTLWVFPPAVREIVTLLCVIFWGRGNSMESAIIVLEVAFYIFPIVKQFIYQAIFDQQY